MRGWLFAVGLSPLLGCGSVAFYETVPAGCVAVTTEMAPATAEATLSAPPATATPQAVEERAVERVESDGWRDSIRQLIQEPPPRVASDDPACVEDLLELKVQVSTAIELAVAHRDWRRERCLSTTGQTLGTLYHASVGVPFTDQRGRILSIKTQCSASQMARVAQACAS